MNALQGMVVANFDVAGGDAPKFAKEVIGTEHRELKGFFATKIGSVKVPTRGIVRFAVRYESKEE
jgi:hypothetical protein